MALFFYFSTMDINHAKIVSIIKNIDPGFYKTLDLLLTDQMTGESNRMMKLFDEKCSESKNRAKNNKKKGK